MVPEAHIALARRVAAADRVAAAATEDVYIILPSCFVLPADPLLEGCPQAALR